MIRLIIVLTIASLTATLLIFAVDTYTKIFAAVALLGSITYLSIKGIMASHKLDELNRLRKAHEQLDQQTKLIIRTDFELHRVQEELDRRLASLMSLHQLGQRLEVSMRPEEVFGKLDPDVVTNFGFSKGLLGLCSSFESLEWRSLIGVEVSVASEVKAQLISSGLLSQILSKQTPRFF